MSQKPIILTVAEGYAEIDEFFREKGDFDPVKIKIATMYLFGKPASVAPSLNISVDIATDLYKKLDAFEEPQIGSYLKDIMLETLENPEFYSETTQKNLSEATKALRTVEKVFDMDLLGHRDYEEQ